MVQSTEPMFAHNPSPLHVERVVARRLGWLCSSLILLAALLTSTNAQAIKIAIRGTSTLEARSEQDGDALVVRGLLRDDVGSAIVGGQIELGASGESGERLGLPQPRSCAGDASSTPPKATQDAYTLSTDASGAFCVRIPGGARKGKINLWYAGSTVLGSSAFELPFEPTSQVPTLVWEPKPEQIELDVPRATVSVRAIVSSGVERPAMTLGLFDGEKRLSSVRVGGDGLVTFDISTADISGPSVNEIEVRALDLPGVVPIKTKVPRVARVALVGSAPAKPVVPHDGFTLELLAETTRGPCPTGAIEAIVDNEPVGVGRVEGGRALVKPAFDVVHEGVVKMDLRFISTTPALKGGSPLSLQVPVKPPPFWRSLPLVGLGFAVLLWMMRGWRRAPKVEQAAPVEPHEVKPEMLVNHAVAPAAGGWGGVVLDAHDGSPIDGAAVMIVGRDFVGERVLQTTTTDRAGRFHLDGEWAMGRVLVIEGSLHSTMSQPLPKPTGLTIKLVTRRRALLDKLLNAARQAGGRWWPAQQELTPRQVSEAALELGRQDVHDWAEKTENAVFGPDVVDATREAQVEQASADLRWNRGPGGGSPFGRR